MWTIALTKYVVMPGSMFVVNVRDRACAGYYSLNPRFDNLSGSIPFRLPNKILDALKYFGLYKLASLM